MSRLPQIIVLMVVIVVANSLDQSLLSVWNIRPLDLTVVVLLVATVNGMVGPASLAAMLAGLLRAMTTIHPWFAYGASYLLAVLVAWVVIRRVVAERSTASLLAASSAGSLAFGLGYMLFITSARIFQPSNLTIDWWPTLANTGLQTLVQPLVVWSIWRLSGGGQFASIRQASSRPF